MKTDGSKVFNPLLFRCLFLVWVTKGDYQKICVIVCTSSKILGCIFGDQNLTSIRN